MKKEFFNVCVVILNSNVAGTETFIDAHIKNIDGSVKVYPINKPLNINKQNLNLRSRIIRKVQYRIPFHRLKKKLLFLYEEEFIKHNDIDVILAEYGPMGVKILRTAMKLGIPLVVHFHGYDAYSRGVLDNYKEQYDEMFKYAKKIIVVSEDMKTQLLSLGAQQEKIVVNPCGSDPREFSLSDPSQAPTIYLAVGRFVSKKAPHITILAFKKVLEHIPEAKLIMVGEGELRSSTIGLVRSLGIDNNIIFKGACHHEEVSELMKRTRCFVQHSVVDPISGDSEGTPVAIVEASMSGLPVVATKHMGIKELIIDGKTGFLVDEFDIETMAQKMLLFGENPSLAKEMGLAGRDHVSENYSLKQHIKKLNEILISSIQ